ncbi:MAG TPA: DUF2282 domain-containing protein [Burkholderiaceae bacterium]|nr:DUF2282 domain-containing protein [Burkholderiaceae bacterium]
MKQAMGNAAVLGTALMIALGAVHRYTHLLPGTEKPFALQRERCYGIARAGHNDCGTSQHSCAGQARREASDEEWLSLPAGTCERIAGGRVRGPA